jgi:exodeoxyribonuclease V gamma subunit
VRHRFGFADDDLDRLRDWVPAAGIRWGLDGDHRGGWDLPGVDHGTWRAGLDRLLLGVAMAGDVDGGADGVGDVLPLDDVDSAGIDLAGRFAELVDRVAAACDLMAGRHPVEGWTDALRDVVDGLTATGPRDAWQRAQLETELAAVAADAAGSGVEIGLADLRMLLGPVLAGRPTRAGFRTGALTVCTLVPMRSVPHRVICLLGLDDGTFPRRTVRDGDHVLARDPWIGERDPRSEDRQLLLDAVCAAEDRLVITYTGADERTGSVVPPAVPLGELLDAIDRTARAPDGRRVRDVVTVRHPLQPFDARNFTAGRLGRPGPFSFDRLSLDGAVAALSPATAPPPFLPVPLPAGPAVDVELHDLHHLLRHPARGFLRQRLQVAGSFRPDDPEDALAVSFTRLQEWAAGERLLAQRLRGLDPAACRDVERRRELLPPGPLGDAVLQEVSTVVDRLVAAADPEWTVGATSEDVDVVLPDGTRLTGTVGGIRGDRLLAVSYSRFPPRQRLETWVDLVALSAARPEVPWRAVLVHRAETGDGVQRVVLGPLPADEVAAALWELVTLHRVGLRAPLPLPLKAGAAYAGERGRGSDVGQSRAKAAEEWAGRYRRRGERVHPEHALVHGPDAPLDVLLAHRPEPDEQGDGWPPDEPDRFGVLARRLWARVIQAERRQP